MGSKRKAQKQLTRDNAASEHADEHEDEDDDEADGHTNASVQNASSHHSPSTVRKKLTARRTLNLAPQSPLATHSVRAVIPPTTDATISASTGTANGFLASNTTGFGASRPLVTNPTTKNSVFGSLQQPSAPFSFGSLPSQQPSAASGTLSSANNSGRGLFGATLPASTGLNRFTEASLHAGTADASVTKANTIGGNSFNIFGNSSLLSANAEDSSMNSSKKPTGMDFSKFTSMSQKNTFSAPAVPSATTTAQFSTIGTKRHASEVNGGERVYSSLHAPPPPPYSSTDKKTDAVKLLLSENRFKLHAGTRGSAGNAAGSSKSSTSSRSSALSTSGRDVATSKLPESTITDCMTQIHTRFGLLNAAFEKAFLHSTKFFISADCSPLMLQYVQEASKLCDMAETLGRLSIIKEFSRNVDRYQRIVADYEVEGAAVSSVDRIPGPLQPIVNSDNARGQPRVEDLVSTIRQQQQQQAEGEQFSGRDADENMGDDDNNTLVSSGTDSAGRFDQRNDNSVILPAEKISASSFNTGENHRQTSAHNLDNVMQFARWAANSSTSTTKQQQQPQLSTSTAGFSFGLPKSSAPTTAGTVSGGFQLPGVFPSPPPQQQQNDKSSSSIVPVGFKLGSLTTTSSATPTTASTGIASSVFPTTIGDSRVNTTFAALPAQASVSASFSFKPPAASSSFVTPSSTTTASSALFSTPGDSGSKFSLFKPASTTTTTNSMVTQPAATITPPQFNFNFGSLKQPPPTTTTSSDITKPSFGFFPATTAVSAFGTTLAAPATSSTATTTATSTAPQFARQPFNSTSFSFGSLSNSSSSQQQQPSSSLFGNHFKPLQTNEQQQQQQQDADATSGGGGGGNENDDDTKPYEPPKPEIVDVNEPDAVMSVKCKLFYFDTVGNKWESKAIGMAHLKKLAEAGNNNNRHCQLIVRMSNPLGTVLLNVRLNFKQNQVQQADQTNKPAEPGKPAALEFRSVSMPPIDEKQPDKLFKFMMRVRTAADRDKFIDTIRSLTT